jgi:hypothetical protein
MKKKNRHLGSSFDDFLREDGVLELVEARARKRVLSRQLEQLMRARQVTKATLAHRMGTSRSQLDRLLDPSNASVTLLTMTAAARALGTVLDLTFLPSPRQSSRAAHRPRAAARSQTTGRPAVRRGAIARRKRSRT